MAQPVAGLAALHGSAVLDPQSDTQWRKMWGLWRSFRVERIRSLEELPERFQRPATFDLERYWSESSARFTEVSRSSDCVATLRVRNAGVERVTYYWPAEIISRGKRHALVRVTFPGTEVAIFHALAWCEFATLLEPAHLRDAMVAAARRALRLYAGE